MVGKLEGLQGAFREELTALEAEAGFTFAITSGKRDPAGNTAAGGVSDSAHLTGIAVDIRVLNSRQRYLLVQAALARGFTRIGIGKTFVHLDRSPTLPSPVMWTYYQ